MAFAGMLNRQLMLLVLISLGFLFGRLGLLERKSRRFVSELVMKVLMPCSLLTVLMVENVPPEKLQGFGIALAGGFVMETVFFLLSKPLVLKARPGQHVVLRYALTSPNAAFMGIPIIGGLFGADGLLYLAALLVPVNFFMYFVALRLFLPKEGPRPKLWKQLLHPALIAVLIGFVFMLSGLRPPVFLAESISALGACTTPVSMILIGGILASVNLKTLFSPSAFYFCGLRLVALPLLALGAVLLLGLPPLVAGVLVLTAGMPAAVSTAALATTHGGNDTYASGLVFLSTVFSLFSLPLLALLLGAALPL